MRTQVRFPQSIVIAAQPGRAKQLAGDFLRVDLLQRLLAVPSYSRQEGRMVDFLSDHVREGAVGLRGTCASDHWNNVFIRKGDAPFCPCVTAHLDTVHPARPVNIVQQDGILFGLDEHDRRTGIGADDKAGIFICLELLERLDDIAIALFGSEEVGCVGVQHAPGEWFDKVGYVIEFDCPGRGLVSQSSGGTQLFASQGEFIQTAGPVLHAHGLCRWENHPLSDIKVLRQRFGLSCLNVSCGYHNWHSPDEYLVLDEVEAALAAGEDLVQALGCRRYPFGADEGDAGSPLREVTGFHLA